MILFRGFNSPDVLHKNLSYDRYGNRSAQNVTAGAGPSNAVSVSATSNRITDPGYSYNTNGNMTNDGLNALTYDAESHLVSSTQVGATTSYAYDGNSLRVKKVSGATTTVYIFSGTKVIAEYAAGAAVGSPTREYIYSGSQLLVTLEGGATTTYYQGDHLSARLTTDTAGNIVAQQGHYPFGESWYQGAGGTKWQFTSYERDSESGNDYAIFRYHVSRLGRFNSPDAVAGSPANPQSLNRYAYVLDDPVNLVDPLGLRERPKFAVAPSNLSCNLDGLAVDCTIMGSMIEGGSAFVCPNNDCAGLRPASADYPGCYVANDKVYCPPDPVLVGGRRDPRSRGDSDPDDETTFFDKIKEFLKSARLPGESFAACVAKNISQTTFGLIPPDPLRSAAIMGGTALTGVATTVQTIPSPLNPAVQIPVSSLIGGLVGFGARVLSGGLVSLQAAGTIAVGTTYAVAVAGGAASGLVVGSVINCR